MRRTSSLPTHPGAFLREIVLPETPMPKTEIARRLGVSRQNLYDLINEKISVSAEMAVRLGRLFGNEPRFWANMQTAHDIARVEREMGRLVRLSLMHLVELLFVRLLVGV